MELDSNTCIKLLELLSKVMKKCELDNIIMGILAWRRSLLSFLFLKTICSTDLVLVLHVAVFYETGCTKKSILRY